MSDFDVSSGCGDYPTNNLSNRSKVIKDDKKLDRERRAKGYIQDSTGCWIAPKAPSVFGMDW